MVGRDEVAQQSKHLGSLDRGNGLGLGSHRVEIRRAAHIGRSIIPREHVARLGQKRVPGVVSFEHARRALDEQVGSHVLAHERRHLFVCRPDVRQHDGVSARIDAEGVLRKIDVHRARKRVCHHKRGRHEVILRHVGRDAPFEVTVAR